MYRATLIFLYPFSLSGYYTYFLVSHTLVSTGLWVFSAFSDYLYPSCRCTVGIFLPFGPSIPFLPLRRGYFPAFLALHTLPAAAPWVFSCLSGSPYPSFHCTVGIFLPFRLSIPFLPLRCGYFPAFWALHTLPATVPWVFPAFSALHTLSATAPWVFPPFLALHTLVMPIFCVCCSLTIHRIA